MGIKDNLSKRLAAAQGLPSTTAPKPTLQTGAEAVMQAGFRARVEEAERDRDQTKAELELARQENAAQAALIDRLQAEGRMGAPLELDPNAVRPSPYYNRSRHAHDPERSPSFAQFLPLIRATGGNVQPGMVRPAPDGKGYEIVFGERRLAACRQLGVRFLANVADLSDAELIRLRIAENLGRENLSAWALAHQVSAADALADENERAEALAELGFSKPHVDRLLRIAKLPGEIEDIHPAVDSLSVRTLIDIAKHREAQPAAFNAAMLACRAGNISPGEATRLLTGAPANTPGGATNRLTLNRKGLRLELRCTPEQSQALAARIVNIARELGIDIEAGDAPAK